MKYYFAKVTTHGKTKEYVTYARTVYTAYNKIKRKHKNFGEMHIRQASNDEVNAVEKIK